jgi:hypothetical protein
MMNLGANIEISYTPSAMSIAMKADERHKSVSRKNAFRITLIHGDIVKLSGADFEVCCLVQDVTEYY